MVRATPCNQIIRFFGKECKTPHIASLCRIPIVFYTQFVALNLLCLIWSCGALALALLLPELARDLGVTHMQSQVLHRMEQCPRHSALAGIHRYITRTIQIRWRQGRHRLLTVGRNLSQLLPQCSWLYTLSLKLTGAHPARTVPTTTSPIQ